MAISKSEHREYLRKRRKSRLNSYRSTPEDIDAHYREEGQIQSDYHKRFAYELIQNADDAMEEGKRKVRFELTSDALLVANTGRPINEKDVKALCTMSATTKGVSEEKRATIGHKGRGFSSVLEITERPQVYSKGISFEFNREKSRSEIESITAEDDDLSADNFDGIPLMRLPFEPPNPPSKVETLLNDGYTTVFRFELKPGKRERLQEDISNALRNLNKETVLFLQNLDILEIDVREIQTRWKINRRKAEVDMAQPPEFVTVQQELISGEGGHIKAQFVHFTKSDIPIDDHTGGINENTWGDVEYTRVGIAVRVDERDDGVHIRPLSDRPNVHVFLPTEEACPLPILLNGAFHTAISRTRINVTSDEDNYNAFLLREAADILTNEVLEFVRVTATTVEEYIDCLDFTHLSDEIRENENRVEGRFIQALQSEVQDVEMVPQLEKLANGRITRNTRSLPISDVVIPFYSDNHDNLAELIARIGGPEKVVLDPPDRAGWFPKTTFLHGTRPEILVTLGGVHTRAQEIPSILGSAPDERTPLVQGSSTTDLATDPRLRALIWVWQEIRSDEDAASAFQQACQQHAVFPIGTPDERNVVKHVAKADETQFFFPPQADLPDIDLSGIGFLTPAVYRPAEAVSTREQKELIADLRPALEAIWDVREFQFEEVAQAAILPKLPGGRGTQNDDELRDQEVLDFIRQLASQTIAPENPLPYTERRRNGLFRLCLLPVPTRNGWERAYRVYFGTDWQIQFDPAKRVERLFQQASIDVPYLNGPSSFIDSKEIVELQEGEDEDEDLQDAWREFFEWLGVNHHIRLQTFFPPNRQRQFEATEGIHRHHNSVLATLSESEWEEYRSHLINSFGEQYEGADITNIYRIHSIEYFDELIKAAHEDSNENQEDRFSPVLFNHLAGWWRDELREYRSAVLGTPSTSNYKNRRTKVFNSHEQHAVGTDLWLWKLRRAPWCPTSEGSSKPSDTWFPTEELRVQFSLPDGDKRRFLLPVLPDIVIEQARSAGEFLDALDVRRELSQETFRPTDAERVVRKLATAFEKQEQNVIAEYLRDIKPKYRYITELLPPLRQGQQVEGKWAAYQSELGGVKVLCRRGDGELVFERAEEAYFVRSPDVRERLPAKNISVFILQEPEAASFGRHFSLFDLEKAFEAQVETDDTDLSSEQNTVQSNLRDIAPFILCRLEAERESQDLITNDANGMRDFLEKLTVVDELIVVYKSTITNDETTEMYPDFFLDKNESNRQERAVPILLWSDSVERRNRRVARALCDYLEVSQFEGILALLNTADESQRYEHLRLSGAPAERTDVEAKRQQLYNYAEHHSRPTPDYGDQFNSSDDDWETDSESRYENDSADETNQSPGQQTKPTIYSLNDLQLGESSVAEPIGSIRDLAWGEDGERSSNTGSESPSNSSPGAHGSIAGYIDEIDRRGMEIAIAAERKRLRESFGTENPEQYVVEVHTSERIETELENNSNAAEVLRDLQETAGIPLPYPGFDILTIDPNTNNAERLIELKTSGLNVRKVSVTWNEWKTAMTNEVQDRFYLYVIGNLRTDVSGEPYIREIRNPFTQLTSREREQTQTTREVQVNVTHFDPEKGEIFDRPLFVIDSDT